MPMDRNGTNITYEAKMIVIATGIFDHLETMGVEGEDIYEGHRIIIKKVILITDNM